MARKKKNRLASGNYRVQVRYTGTDGKTHTRSFTAPTKTEAQAMAQEWKYSKKEEGNVERMTVKEGLERYVALKEAVLSPSTVRGYKTAIRDYFSGGFSSRQIYEIGNPDIQLFVSDLSARVAPKTVHNTFGLFVSAYHMFRPDFHIQVTLPQRRRYENYCPSDADIMKLCQAIKGTELEKAVLLAAFGTLRRGEIAPLTAADLCGDVLTVSKSMVMDESGGWVTKEPKTPGSVRKVELPDSLVGMLPKHGRLVSMNPGQITKEFGRALKKLDIPHFRFHDLRHYSASILHALGVPDQYIMQRGEWSTDGVMKSVYRNVIDIEERRQTRKVTEHFESMLHGSCTKA